MSRRLLHGFNGLFPLWAILLSVLAYNQPALFAPRSGWIVPLLSAVMFFMGLTLGLEDFKRISRAPRQILVGVGLQFILMPLLAWLISVILQLPAPLAIGLILVGSCAGGTASNVICYLARGNVALSITMTLVSTLVGVVATPLLCWLYLSQTVEFDRVSMLVSIVRMVLLPVVLGVACNHLLRRWIRPLEPLLAAFAILTIALIIAIIVARNHDNLATVGALTLTAVVMHNGLGLALAYSCSRLLGFTVIDCRTIAIEVGMQNSGLGVALSLKYFSAAAALPGAVFSIWHNISGALLAAYWRRDAERARA